MLNAPDQIMFVAPPDFELPQDSNGDNVYELLIEANDGQGMTTTRLVRVTVINANEAPTTVPQVLSVNGDEPITVGAPGLLAGAGDVDGDALVAILLTGPLHGSVTLNPDGSFTYVPDPNFSGGDSFTYQVLDGVGGTAVGTVTLNVGNVIPLPPGFDPSVGVTRTTTVDNDNEDVETETVIVAIDVAAVTSATNPKVAVRSTTGTSETLDNVARITVASSQEISDAKPLPLATGRRQDAPAVAKTNQPEQAARVMEGVIDVTQPGLLWNDLDEMQEQFDSAADVPYLALGGTASVAASLSVGYVVWLIRGGSILAGVMAQLPAWRFIDPLPILAQFDDDEEDEDEDEESLASLVESANDDDSQPARIDDILPRPRLHRPLTIGAST